MTSLTTGGAAGGSSLESGTSLAQARPNTCRWQTWNEVGGFTARALEELEGSGLEGEGSAPRTRERVLGMMTEPIS